MAILGSDVYLSYDLAEPGFSHILESDDSASGFSDGLESDGVTDSMQL